MKTKINDKAHDEVPQEYLYDAFISYRHISPDKVVAERLQELLENFRPYRKNSKRLNIFRDQSELPTSNDLGSEIREALLQSRFLIVICSEHIKESHWCMEEIRLFKEAHHGRTDNILTLIVSGEPDQIFPEELCWENRPVFMPDGRKVLQRKTIVPLGADIRAQTRQKSLRKLKFEFLRIAAPILECGFDELFQRRQRRHRRNMAIIISGVLTILIMVLLVVSFFAYRTWVSENNYRNILVDNYTREGNRYANSGKPQEALLYYTEALSLDPEKTSAASGAVLLLQEYLWPVCNEEMTGCIRNNAFLPMPDAVAGDPEKDRYLYIFARQAEVLDGSGQLVEKLDADYRSFAGSASGWWSFAGEDEWHFYDPETGERRSIAYPNEISKGCAMDDPIDSLLSGYASNALALPDDRAIVAYNGIVHIYDFNEQGIAVETAQADLAEVFFVDAGYQGLSRKNDIYLSEDGSLALISNYSLVALYDTRSLALKAVVTRYLDYLTGMDISLDNDYFALSYGNIYRDGLFNPGGLFEVYSCDGKLLYTSPKSEKEALEGTMFDPANPERLLVWGTNSVRVWNWKEGGEIMAPVLKSGSHSACFTKEGTLLVDNGNQTVTAYVPAKFSLSAPDLKEEKDEISSVLQYGMNAEGPDGMSLSVNSSELAMMDKEGRILNTVTLPAAGQKVALSQDFRTVYLYHTNTSALMCVSVDFEERKFGEFISFDTGGEAALSIWFGDGWLAAETVSRSLILFDEDGRQICKILPEHNGNVVSMLVDSDSRYIICILEMTEGDAGSFHFDKTGIIELWDASSQLLLFSFEKSGQEIDTAYIAEDETLIWSIKDEQYICRFSMPVPDSDAIGFLRGICSRSLDDDRNLVEKKPYVSGLRLGNWSLFADKRKESY